MGDCRGLKSIYPLDPYKRQCDGDKDDNKNDHGDNKRHDEENKNEEERDKDPHHAYKDPDRSIQIIFARKVALENGR
jgi:ABC-type Zn2+ transport system substrate-binding protein/surface adhesin